MVFFWIGITHESEVSQFPLFLVTEESKKQAPQEIYYFGLTLNALERTAGEDWGWIKTCPATLEAWAKLLYERQMIQQGQIPASFTAKTCCKHCGEVAIPPSLVNEGYVLGCPFCSVKHNAIN